MIETINLIEQKLGENKEVLRRLETEQENFITALADNHLKKKQLSNENLNLERQLKELYDQEYNRKDTCGSAKLSKSDKNTNSDYRTLTPNKDDSEKMDKY